MREAGAKAHVNQPLLGGRGIDAFHRPHHQRPHAGVNAEEEVGGGAPLVQKMCKGSLVLGGDLDRGGVLGRDAGTNGGGVAVVLASARRS